MEMEVFLVKKVVKKWLAALLVVVMIFSSVPLSSLAGLEMSNIFNFGTFSAKAESGSSTLPVYSTDEKEIFKSLGFDPYNVFADLELSDEIKLPSVPILGTEYELGSIKAGLKLPLNTYLECKVDVQKKTIEVTFGYKQKNSATIGPDGNKTNYWSESYNELKNLYTNVTGNKVDTTKLWNQFSSLRGQVKELDCSLGLNVTAKIAGFAKFSFATNKLDFEEGGAVIGVSAKADFQAPTTIPLVYVGLSLSPSVEGKFKLSPGDSKPVIAGEASGKFAASGYIGLGQESVAKTYIKASLTGALKASLSFPKESLSKVLKVSMEADFSAESKVLGFTTFEAKWPLGNVQLYPSKSKAKLRSKLYNDNVDTSDLYSRAELMDRDYSLNINSQRSNGFYLQNIYSMSQPQLLTLANGKLMLIWVGDDGSKNTENRTSLFYSLFDGNQWSDTSIICENDEFNESPKAVAIGDTVYLLWQKTKFAISSDENLTSAIEKVELYYSIFDGTSFSEISAVKSNDNDIIEFGHNIVAADNGVYITWVENSDNDIYLNSGKNILKYAFIASNGSISDEEIILNDADSSIGYIPIIRNNKLNIIFVDNSSGTNTLYITDGLSINKLFSSDMYIGNFRYLSDTIYYLSGTDIRSYNLQDKTDTIMLSGVLGTFELIENENDIYLTTILSDESNYYLSASKYDSTENSFGKLTTAYKSNRYINDYSVAIFDGACIFALNTSIFDINTDNVFSDYDLKVVNTETYNGISVDSQAWCNDNIKLNSSVELGSVITNSGNTDINSLTYTITDLKTNKQVDSKTITTLIPAGEDEAVYVPLNIPENFTYREYKIEFFIDDESDTSDNFAIVELGNADLTFSNINTNYKDGKFVISGSISNTGFDAAVENKITVYDNKIGDTIITEFSISNIEPNQATEFEFELPEDYAYAAEQNEYHGIYIVVETDSKELKKADNEYNLVFNDEFWRELKAATEESEVIVAEELFEGFPTTLINRVADTIFNFKSSINITAYELKTEEEITALFSAIQKYYPAKYTALLSSTQFTHKIIRSPSLAIITNIRFYYGDDADLDVFEKRTKDLEKEISSIVDQVKEFDDFEKALYIHDYIVLHCEYDLELADYMDNNGGIIIGSELYNERYTAYSVLVNGTGVCDSYATAYRALMNAAGVECVYLSSTSMNHAWNEVKLDGEWYHVDCTWDDPVPDSFGESFRTYFLRTDVEMQELKHHSWTPVNYSSTSTTYSLMPRQSDITQKYDYANDLWYFLKSNNLYKAERLGDNQVLINKMYAKTLSVDNGKIYYSNGRGVYLHDAESNTSNIVYILPTYKSGDILSKAYLKNIYIHDNIIEFYKFVALNDGTTRILYDYSTLKDKPVISENQKGKCGENSTWRIVNGVDLYIEGSGDITDPSWNIFGFDIKNVYMSEEITSIPEESFKNFTSIELLQIPFIGKSKDSTEDKAVLGYLFGKSDVGVVQYFKDDGNQMYGYKFDIPESLKKVVITNANRIPYGAFCNCSNITNIALNDGIENINQYAFYNCTGLTNLVIPNSVNSIEEGLLEGCNSLESITLPFVGSSRDSTNTYDSVLGHIFGRTSQDNGIAQYCTLDNGSISYYYYAIPSSLKNVTVTDATQIPFGAFCNCSNIQTIALNDGISKIDGYSFYNCSTLNEINLNESVSAINSNAFNGCSSLNKIVIFNRDCTIYNSSTTISSTATIYGYANSTANKYADTFSRKFTPLDDAHEHSYIAIESVKPDCTNDGYTVYKCDCGETYTKTLNKLGHSYSTEWTVDKAATCSEEGSKSHHCIRCDDKTDVTVIEKIAHSYIEVVTESTCTEDGYTTYTCEVCGNSYKDNYISKLGHDFVWVTDKEATCGETGVKHEECTRCDVVRSENTVIETTGDHNYVSTVTAPTCTTEGYTTYVCEKCGNSYTDNVTEKIPHAWTWIIDKDATCGATGIKHEECSVCHAIQNENTVIEATGKHDYVSVVTEPTCTEKGCTTHTCKVCNYSYTDNYTNMIEHKWTWVTDKEPTCNASGIKHEECSVCNEKRNINTVIDSTGEHTYVAVVTEPTCTSKGYTTYTCSGCGTSYIDDETDMIPHNWKWIVDVEATCGENGIKHQECAKCNAKQAENTVIEATGKHTWKWVEDKSATCGAIGYKHQECTVCGVTQNYDTEIPATGLHIYNKIITAPTCTKDGYTTFTCSVCNHSYISDKIAKTEHIWTWVIDKDATCGEIGVKHEECVNCDAIQSEDTVIPATGKHTYGETTIVTAPTCKSTGKKVSVCTICGYELEEVIEKVNHRDGLVELYDHKGDADGDGKVTSKDARLVLRYSANLEKFDERQISVSDVNFDKKVNAIDARIILRVSARLETLPN